MPAILDFMHILYFFFHITFIASDMRQATYRYLQKCGMHDEGRISGSLQTTSQEGLEIAIFSVYCDHIDRFETNFQTQIP